MNLFRYKRIVPLRNQNLQKLFESTALKGTLTYLKQRRPTSSLLPSYLRIARQVAIAARSSAILRIRAASPFVEYQGSASRDVTSSKANSRPAISSEISLISRC